MRLRQLLRGTFSLRQIVNDPDKYRFLLLRFTDGQVHRKRRTVLSLPLDLAPDADDLSDVRSVIIG